MSKPELYFLNQFLQSYWSSTILSTQKEVANSQENTSINNPLPSHSYSTKVMGPTPLLVPPASLNTHHKDTPTVSSKESFASEAITPEIKLKSKFQDIQLSLSNREQIYETLLKLDHVERGEYKVDKLLSVYDISTWFIFKSDTIDWVTHYIIKFSFNDTKIVVDVQWDTDVALFKDILELLHGLSLQFRFIIDSEYLNQRKENINKYLKQLEYGNDFLFHWDVTIEIIIKLIIYEELTNFYGKTL